MVKSVVTGVLPVALLIAFGYVLGKRGVFDKKATAVLSQFVVTIALPVSLFLAAVGTPRAELDNPRYVAAVAIAFIGFFVITFAIGRLVLRNNTDEAAIEGLTVAFPDMAFIGLPILVATLGTTTGTLPVLVGNIVTSLVVVPSAVAILSAQGAAELGPRMSVRQIAWQAVKPPLVWLPILGVVLAIAGVTHLPSVVGPVLDPLGKAAGGVALITIGLILSQERALINRDVATNTLLKLVAMPLAMLALVHALGIDGDARRALLLLAITPTATAAGMLSLRYRTYVRDASPTILATTVLSFVGYLVVLALT